MLRKTCLEFNRKICTHEQAVPLDRQPTQVTATGHGFEIVQVEEGEDNKYFSIIYGNC
jgi:hypothetical protein